jgi:hypothetical protein
MFGLSLISVGVGVLIGSVLTVLVPAIYKWTAKQVASAEAKAHIDPVALAARISVLEAKLK